MQINTYINERIVWILALRTCRAKQPILHICTRHIKPSEFTAPEIKLGWKYHGSEYGNDHKTQLKGRYKGWFSAMWSNRHLEITTLREQERASNTEALLRCFCTSGERFKHRDICMSKQVWFYLSFAVHHNVSSQSETLWGQSRRWGEWSD